MPSVEESIGVQNQLRATLDLGIDTLSVNQEITFTKYIKLVLPLDGYVFWVRADLVSQGALYNVAEYNRNNYNQAAPVTAAPTVKVKGSLHYATDQVQREDETFGLNRVLFTAESEIQDFNQVSPHVMFLGTFQGIRFAFTARRQFYQQADIFHYEGDAVYPAMETQIVDSLAGFDTSNVIVSNSLPAWLGLNKFMPMYPSYLLPENIEPLYASVHIQPESTNAIQAVPRIDSATSSHYQLVTDHVKITMYGLRNFNALDWVDYVLQYMTNYDVMGLMNMPVIRDEKRLQSELNVIAMKKSIEFDVSYYQTRVNDVAKQLILSATMSISATVGSETFPIN